METIVKNVARKNKAEIGLTLVNFPGDGWTVNGKAITATTVEFLVNYGVRQYLADGYAAATNLSEAQGLFAKRCDKLLDGTVGVRETRVGSLPDNPAASLALKNAKAVLMARFEATVPGAKTMAAYAKHPKIAPYFKITGDKATWIDAKVEAWMAEQAKKFADGVPNARDFMAEAEAALAVDPEVELDF